MEKLYSTGVGEEAERVYRELFRARSERDTTEKQAMAAAAVILADELACRWVFDGLERPMTMDQIAEFLASKAAVSAGDRGYKYLCDWVTANSSRLCGRSDNGQEIYGAMEEDYAGNASKAYIIRSVFDRVLQDAGYSTAAMLSYLKQEGLIETRGRNNTRGKRINGVLTECVCMILPSEEREIQQYDELPL